MNKTTNIKKTRKPNATLKLKQKTVMIYKDKGIKAAVEYSKYSDKAIYKWVAAATSGELRESKTGRPRITKSKIISELENPHFIENLNEDEKNEVIILMRELLL